jgi:hypothetical protein
MCLNACQLQCLTFLPRQPWSGRSNMAPNAKPGAGRGRGGRGRGSGGRGGAEPSPAKRALDGGEQPGPAARARAAWPEQPPLAGGAAVAADPKAHPHSVVDPCSLSLNAAHYNELLQAYDAVMAHELFAGICMEPPLAITAEKESFSGRMDWVGGACLSVSAAPGPCNDARPVAAPVVMAARMCLAIASRSHVSAGDAWSPVLRCRGPRRLPLQPPRTPPNPVLPWSCHDKPGAL